MNTQKNLKIKHFENSFYGNSIESLIQNWLKETPANIVNILYSTTSHDSSVINSVLIFYYD